MRDREVPFSKNTLPWQAAQYHYLSMSCHFLHIIIFDNISKETVDLNIWIGANDIDEKTILLLNETSYHLLFFYE